MALQRGYGGFWFGSCRFTREYDWAISVLPSNHDFEDIFKDDYFIEFGFVALYTIT